MDKLKEKVVDILKELMAADGIIIRGVYERSDAPVRKKEGMEPYKGFIGESVEGRRNVRPCIGENHRAS